MTENKLTVKQKLGFGIFDMGGNMFFTLMSFWALKFLTDTVGIAAAWAGVAVMIGKIWDAVSDPLMGYISDRTLSRFGRRRVYLLYGAVPMLLSMLFFFTAPEYLPSSMHIIWAIIALVLINTASTVINVPYSSLTPELTSDYNEQSSLNGYRFGCAVFGTLAGAGAVEPLVQLFARAGSPNPLADSRGFSIMGLILGSLMMIVTLLTFFGTREKKVYTKEDLPKENFFSAYRAVFKNKPFVVLISTYALHMTGLSFLTTILAYYTREVLGREDITTFALIFLLLTAMLFIPISVMVSKKIGKMRTYQICFAILSSACAMIFFFGHHLPRIEFFYALMVYAGIGVGFSYVAPFAMVPDAIKHGAAEIGEGKEGSYYGMWTFVSKFGTALAIFVAGLILEWGGYISHAGEAEITQPASVFNAIRVIIGPIPIVILIAAIFVVNRYPEDAMRPIDKKEYR